jgi:cold shock CspA family protein
MKGQSERKRGTLISWKDERGFGIIRVGSKDSLERYFLHVSKIKSGTGSPTPGMLVNFRVSEAPVQEGQLAQAVDVHVDVNSLPQPTMQKTGGVN